MMSVIRHPDYNFKKKLYAEHLLYMYYRPFVSEF